MQCPRRTCCPLALLEQVVTSVLVVTALTLNTVTKLWARTFDKTQGLFFSTTHNCIINRLGLCSAECPWLFWPTPSGCAYQTAQKCRWWLQEQGLWGDLSEWRIPSDAVTTSCAHNSENTASRCSRDWANPNLRDNCMQVSWISQPAFLCPFVF